MRIFASVKVKTLRSRAAHNATYCFVGNGKGTTKSVKRQANIKQKA